jgi:hypothetical protein
VHIIVHRLDMRFVAGAGWQVLEEHQQHLVVGRALVEDMVTWV